MYNSIHDLGIFKYTWLSYIKQKDNLVFTKYLLLHAVSADATSLTNVMLGLWEY